MHLIAQQVTIVHEKSEISFCHPCGASSLMEKLAAFKYVMKQMENYNCKNTMSM